MAHINIEIKARTSRIEEIRETLKKCGADFRGTDNQVDTYFKVNQGRLKLREGNIENHLIYYEREDIAEPKKSVVILYKNLPGSNLKEILTGSLGIRVVVDKNREIYFIENVKFHLDVVRGLGSFVEIEAIDLDGSIGEKKLYKQCSYYLDLFGLTKEDLITTSYSDLLLAKN
ncbi:MAG: class IV adenylate cyclase [bacterium]|nr:class IV adenylate cyclase [bacterium]